MKTGRRDLVNGFILRTLLDVPSFDLWLQMRCQFTSPLKPSLETVSVMFTAMLLRVTCVATTHAHRNPSSASFTA